MTRCSSKHLSPKSQKSSKKACCLKIQCPVPKAPAPFDSEHDENLTLTSDTQKKLQITNYPRLAITRDIQGTIH